MLARLMDAGKWFYAKIHDKIWEGSWLKIDLEIYLREQFGGNKIHGPFQ